MLLGRARSQVVPLSVLWGVQMVMVTPFWRMYLSSLLSRSVNSPEFHDLMRDGQGSLATVAGSGMAGFICRPVLMVSLFGLLMLLRVLAHMVEVALGRYSSDLV